jgi:hypothetical protein
MIKPISTWFGFNPKVSLWDITRQKIDTSKLLGEWFESENEIKEQIDYFESRLRENFSSKSVEKIWLVRLSYCECPEEMLQLLRHFGGYLDCLEYVKKSEREQFLKDRFPIKYLKKLTDEDS